MRIRPLLVLVAPALFACAPPELGTPSAQTDRATNRDGAVATLAPKSGSTVQGTVRFEPREGGVLVVADLRGLKPGAHGFHVHETGDCSAADATSAGSHYAGGGTRHGDKNDPQAHAGDFGNIVADEQGNARAEIFLEDITLDGARSVLGRAVIVHEKADDLQSQPSGDAGARVACGVIQSQSS